MSSSTEGTTRRPKSKRGISIKTVLATVKSPVTGLDQFPFAERVVNGAVKVLGAIEGYETTEENLPALAADVYSLELAIRNALLGVPVVEVPPELKRHLEDLVPLFEEINRFVISYRQRSRLNKSLMNEGDAIVITEYTNKLKGALRNFDMMNAIRHRVDVTATRFQVKAVADAIALQGTFLHSTDETLNAMRQEHARLLDEGNSAVLNVVQNLEGTIGSLNCVEAVSRLQDHIHVLDNKVDAILTLSHGSSVQPWNSSTYGYAGLAMSRPMIRQSTMPFSLNGSSRQKPLTCLENCQCRCHRGALLRSPKRFSSLLGEVYIRYAGTTFGTAPLADCDEQTCRGCRAYAYIKWYLPLWLRFRMSSEVVSSSLTFCIQTRREIPFLEGIFKSIARLQNLKLIQQSIRSDGSLINAINPHGQGVLHYVYLAYHFQGQYAGQWLVKVTDMLTLLIECGADPQWQDNFNQNAVHLLLDELLVHTLQRSVTERTVALMKIAVALRRSPQDLWDEYLEERQFTHVHKALLGMHPKGWSMSEVLDQTSREPELVNSIDTRDSKGWSPLAWAVEYGWMSAVAALLTHGADPKQRTQVLSTSECTLLHHTIITWMRRKFDDCLQNFQMLLSAGAEINALDGDGLTALHCAAYADRYDFALRLASFAGDKLDWDARTKDGKTALDVAKRWENSKPDLLILLTNRGVPSAKRRLELFEQLQADGTVGKDWYINDSGDFDWGHFSDDENSGDESEANISDEEDSAEEFHDALDDFEES